MNERISRRAFVQSTAAAGLGLGVAGPSIWRGGKRPGETVVVAVMGVNGRGNALAKSFARARNAEVAYIADVDERAVAKTVGEVTDLQGKAPRGIEDFRDVLDGNDIDALVIAAPDHWHAPAALMALQAGKHVYVEKPCGHNPQEGEMLVSAQQKYGKLVQMGTQQRSSRETISALADIHDGLIGRPYFAKTWYANARGPIGNGQPAEVPSWLNYDLWQGPAPRVPYQDNLIHYNWHWFQNWGTGEACNNGTHEIDVARLLLGVDFPTQVASNGGRYHFDDDWEFYDTQMISFDFPGEVTITWEGRSCNGFPVEGRGRGTLVHGTEGTILIDRDGYIVYDLKNKEVKRVMMDNGVDALNTVGDDQLTDLHIQNFVDTVRGEGSLNAPIEEGHKSVLLCHLGNIAQRTGQSLSIDPANGHITDSAEAQALWGRTYAPGWAPAV